MIDDPGLVISVRDAIDAHGVIPGLLAHIGQMAQGDTTWGLFRPAYWVYPSLVYWLPIGIAHLFRLMLLVVAIVGPLAALRRRGASWRLVAAAACVMLAGSTTLMLGLNHVSLQELSGAAFVGLGLWIRNPWGRVASWTVAAWFKSPFAWLLVGDAIVAWRMGARRRAAVTAVIAVTTLAAAAVMARTGSYTSSYLESDGLLGVVTANAGRLVDVNLLLPIVAAAWWFAFTRTRPRFDAQVLVLLVGLLGYTAQMLPWRVTGYYQGGIAYLLTLGLAYMLTEPAPMRRSRLLVALVAPIVAALLAVSSGVADVLTTNARYRQITDCLVAMSQARVVVAPEFGPEAAVRIAQNAHLNDPDWPGFVTYAADVSELTQAPPGSVLIVSDAEASGLEGIRALCKVPAAVIAEVRR